MANVKISQLPTGVPTQTSIFPFVDEGTTYQGAISAITPNSTVEVTYSELVDKITGSALTPSSYYIITNFKTCYDQPNFDYDNNPITSGNYKDNTDVQPIVVFATSSNTISDVAYQPTYPNDKIKYDWTFSATEVTQGVAYGRITERIDEFNNRTDYDHRQIKFKRYRYYEVNFNSPYNGTVEVQYLSGNSMTVSGTNTNFTSLIVGDKVGFDNANYKVFEIINIDGDSGMTITGLTTVSVGPNVRMYSASWSEYSSYRQNNIEGSTPFEEYYTFNLGTNGNINNYIGDYSNLYNWEEFQFLLANNVFYNRFTNNKFGNACYNNSFFDDCDNNNIGNYFYNNITDDDFDGNVIGNWFDNNRITSNFQNNRIGDGFESNYLVQYSFYRNNIMNDFNNNQISGGDFQNNEVGTAFQNNKINGQFYKNDVGNGYNNNEHYSECYGNLIGNGFNQNNIYCQMYENKIGDIFQGNNLGDPLNYGGYSFYKNDIGSDFRNNNCLGTFAFNRIGSEVYNNTIGDGFGYGINTSQGNTIGSYFYDNTIGEYFYNNTVADGFIGNQVYNYFQMNNVKIPFLNGVDFTFYYGNITGFSYTMLGNTASDGIYNGLTGATNEVGTGATFNVEVASGSVVGVTGDSVGRYYALNNIITILGSQIGGTDVSDDLVISVTGITQTPTVYESYNCELFINSGNQNRLSFYDSSDILNIKNINE